MPKSPEETLESMIQNLSKNTGKTLDQWLKIAGSSNIDQHKRLVDHLKFTYDIGHGYANLIAQKALQPEGEPPEADELVDFQYAGKKADLRPIYDKLIAALLKFGDDVEVSPKKAYVSMRRGKQFAILQPSTATRLDVGINLKSKPAAGRLEASGSFNSMVSHRVRLENIREVDAELITWLREAYEEA